MAVLISVRKGFNHEIFKTTAVSFITGIWLLISKYYNEVILSIIIEDSIILFANFVANFGTIFIMLAAFNKEYKWSSP